MRYGHGTHAAYVIDRCRCPDCTRANREYEKNRVRQKAYGRTRWCYDVDPVRDHIAQLRAAGYGTRTIADIAGIDRKTIQAIVGGISRGRARTKQPAIRILKATAAAILAIDVPTNDPIDEIAIERVLSGDLRPQRRAQFSKEERLEVIRRWRATGRSLNELRRRTGWNIHRDLRELQEAS